jgi:hypothetical protein
LEMQLSAHPLCQALKTPRRDRQQQQFARFAFDTLFFCPRESKCTSAQTPTEQMALGLLLRAAARCRRAPAGSIGVLSHRAFASAAQPAVAPPSPSGDADLDAFRESVREFAASVVAPHAESIDRNNSFPTDVNLWTSMGEFGLLGELERGGASSGDGGASLVARAHENHTPAAPHPLL